MSGTDLEGRVALVTGAGSGIGRAVCTRLAEEGAEVVVTSRTPANVEATGREVERVSGRPPLALAFDVADRRAAVAVVADVVDRYGQIGLPCRRRVDLRHGFGARRRRRLDGALGGLGGTVLVTGHRHCFAKPSYV